MNKNYLSAALVILVVLSGLTGLLCPSSSYAIEISLEGVSVSTAIQSLRTQKCAAVSFIEATQPVTVSLNIQNTTVAEILSRIAERNPSYRSEKIQGRDVLYPASPEFQIVIDHVDVRSQERQEAAKMYVEILRREVPAFSKLLPPLLYGDDRHPIYSDRVNLRPKGRVIEHLVDLLGQDQALYFDFIKARSGLPSLDFERVPCEAPLPAVSRLEPLSSGLTACPWLEVSGERLLARSVESLSVHGVKVEIALAELAAKVAIPLSFIQADPEAKVSLDFHRSTIREILDAIVAQTPGYRYRVIAGHLVLYPLDPKWEKQVDLTLGPAPRLQATRTLAETLRKRLPEFSNLAGPWVLGNSRSYNFQDVVTVAGPATVLDLLVQLLGNRPSTYLLLVKEDGWLGPSLSVSSIPQLRSVKLSAAKTILRRQDETAQLRLVGTLTYDGSTSDLTSGACGTTYTVSDERVLTVSPDGLVTRRGSGNAEVKASNEVSSSSVTFECPPESP